MTNGENTREDWTQGNVHGTVGGKDYVEFEHQSGRITYPVRVATSMRVWGLYSVDV